MDNELIAYCGVDCSACADYLCHMCSGCRQSAVDEGNDCMPIVCCDKRKINCCGECREFPCADMKAFYEESETHREAYKLMCSLCKKE